LAGGNSLINLVSEEMFAGFSRLEVACCVNDGLQFGIKGVFVTHHAAQLCMPSPQYINETRLRNLLHARAATHLHFPQLQSASEEPAPTIPIKPSLPYSGCLLLTATAAFGALFVEIRLRRIEL